MSYTLIVSQSIFFLLSMTLTSLRLIVSFLDYPRTLLDSSFYNLYLHQEILCCRIVDFPCLASEVLNADTRVKWMQLKIESVWLEVTLLAKLQKPMPAKKRTWSTALPFLKRSEASTCKTHVFIYSNINQMVQELVQVNRIPFVCFSWHINLAACRMAWIMQELSSQSE